MQFFCEMMFMNLTLEFEIWVGSIHIGMLNCVYWLEAHTKCDLGHFKNDDLHGSETFAVWTFRFSIAQSTLPYLTLKPQEK